MDEQQRLRRYRDELLRWTATINLIGPEARKNVDAHIEEATAAAAILHPVGEVLDFGSGGGLPAVPMAIVSPEARFHLVEADRRKWAFLKHAARACELNCVVHGDRLDRVLPRFEPGLRFSLITSRAVGSPGAWLPSLLERMTSDGRVALFQREREVEPIPGLVHEGTFDLPRGSENHLVVLRRLEQTYG